MNRNGIRAGAVAVLAALWSTGISAADLTIGVATEPTSLDPHFQALNSNHELAMHVYDTLMFQDATMRLAPALATSWKPIDANTWEFKLREGVQFHNGTPFTANDVAFSIERAPKVPNAPATYRRRVAQVKSTKVVDDHTIHIITKAPTPLLPESLAQLPIISAATGMDAEPAQFNDGSKAYGTGPYTFKEFVRGDRITFAANQKWWGGKPKWDNVTFRWITSAPARTAALLSGDVDVIASVSTTDVAKLEDDDNINVSAAASTRLIYWSLDVGSETSPNITAKDGTAIPNPLRDKRVRKALTMAVDRDAIVDNVMEGLAVPTNQIVAEGFGGYHEGIEIPAFDPAAARSLLSEAGYPDGFKLTIHATNDRYVNDAKLAQAIAQMYSQVGIEVVVETMPVAVYYGKARGHEFAMAQIGWATATGESSAILSPALLKGKRNNYGRWENEEFNTVLNGALSTVDLDVYRAKLARATEIVAEEIPMIPTHNQVAVWAARKGFVYEARANEATLAEAVTAE
jgi:peptide/nickel transport system substrate-binding protein